MLEIDYASEAGSAGVASEFLSLLLILVSFALIVILNSRIRNVKTFQFEILLFTLVVVAAEVPRTLYSLGIIDIDFLSTVGLAIHSASMVILALFVAYRVNGFFRGVPMTALKGSYEELILGSVDKVMTTTFGATIARAVDFYIDRGSH